MLEKMKAGKRQGAALQDMSSEVTPSSVNYKYKEILAAHTCKSRICHFSPLLVPFVHVLPLYAFDENGVHLVAGVPRCRRERLIACRKQSN